MKNMGTFASSGEPGYDNSKEMEEIKRLQLQLQAMTEAMTLKAQDHERKQMEVRQKEERLQEAIARIPDPPDDDGWVYMCRSPNKPGAVKIGKSSKLKERMGAFSCVDPAIECYRKWEVRNVSSAERAVHIALKWFRANRDREPHSASAASGWFYYYDGIEDDVQVILAFYMSIDDRVQRARQSLLNVPFLPHFGVDGSGSSNSGGKGDTKGGTQKDTKKDTKEDSGEPWPPERRQELEKMAAEYKKDNNIAKFKRGERHALMLKLWEQMQGAPTTVQQVATNITINVPVSFVATGNGRGLQGGHIKQRGKK